MFNGVATLLETRRTAPIADRGMIISVVSWILFVIMTCILLTRFALKLALSKKGAVFGWDDTFIVAAAVRSCGALTSPPKAYTYCVQLFSLGQTIAVSFEAQQVLGQHVDQLDAAQLRLFEKVSPRPLSEETAPLMRVSSANMLVASSSSPTWVALEYLYAFSSRKYSPGSARHALCGS
jgi:hypothetical protein